MATKILTRIEESILLALVGNELYGIQIAHAINTATGECLYGQNNLWGSLDKLEKSGLIQSRSEDSYERNDYQRGRSRKYYSLTDKGADELDKLNMLKDKLMKWQPENEIVPVVKSRILSR